MPKTRRPKLELVAARGLPREQPENVHPADELDAVRDQIAAMQARANVLRDYLLAHQDDRRGRHVEAFLVHATSVKVDAKKLRRAFPEVADKVESEAEVIMVKLRPVSK